MKSRTLTFLPEIERIIAKCSYCSLAMVDAANKPYVINMNFGYRDKTVYFHCAPTGKKIDILKNNPHVSVGFSCDHELRFQNSDVACSYSMKYRSVLGSGEVEFVTDTREKVDALDCIMRQYTESDYRYSDPAIENVCVFKVKLDTIEGRAYGY